MKKKGEAKSTPSMRGEIKLTDKQRRFIEEYLIDLNATQAAIRAGYSPKTADVQGSQNLVKLKIYIQQAQNERSARVQITQDDVLRDLIELRDICMGRKSVIITDTVKNSQERTVVAVDNPIFAFEPTGANKALELLGKHLGMFGQKVDVVNSDGSLNRPTIIELISPMLSNDESTD